MDLGYFVPEVKWSEVNWELGSRETLALLIETGLDYILSSWKPVVSLWHPYRCTACAACHMMWLASWLSVTSVRTGSMEGKLVLVQENVNCGWSILASSCRICTVFNLYVCFVVVLGWRKTKQLKLTCITAPTVRLHMGHLSVSQHSLCFLVMLLLD